MNLNRFELDVVHHEARSDDFITENSMVNAIATILDAETGSLQEPSPVYFEGNNERFIDPMPPYNDMDPLVAQSY